MAVQPLYKSGESDIFGLTPEIYREACESFSSALDESLSAKAREITTNILFSHGKTLEDPAVLAYLMPTILRVTAAFLVASGYMALTEDGLRDLSKPASVPTDAPPDNVVEFPWDGIQAEGEE